MDILNNKAVTNFVNKPFVRNFVSNLSKRNGIVPVILLESTVIAGRTYQAYKRGGYVEGRERFTEETVTSAVWLTGIGFLSKFADYIIGKKMGIKEIGADIGKDAFRDPFGAIIKKKPELADKLSMLKFGKIFASVGLATYFIGAVLPKINQAITKKQLEEKHESKEIVPLNRSFTSNMRHNKITMQGFLEKAKQKSVSFGSNFSNILNTIAHNFETNDIVKLFTVETAMIAGRATNARNKDERDEILLRDVGSSFFYMFSTPMIADALKKHADKYKGKNTDLDPKLVHLVTEKMKEKLGYDKKMTPQELKIFLSREKQSGLATSFMEKVKHINNGVITLDNFIKTIKTMNLDKKLTGEIIDKARDLSGLQPKKEGKAILSVMQTRDAFSDGLLHDRNFIGQALDIATKPDFVEKFFGGMTESRFKDHTKFVSQESLEGIRKNIGNYVFNICEHAGNEVNDAVLTKFKNRNMLTKLGYMGAGLGISALFLSTLIPKAQYMMTKMRTGKDEFPGVQGLVNK